MNICKKLSALLSTVSKVFERIIYDKIREFAYKTITQDQFGFLPRHSCLQHLLQFLSKIMEVLEDKSQMDVVYVDIKKHLILFRIKLFF